MSWTHTWEFCYCLSTLSLGIERFNRNHLIAGLLMWLTLFLTLVLQQIKFEFSCQIWLAKECFFVWLDMLPCWASLLLKSVGITQLLVWLDWRADDPGEDSWSQGQEYSLCFLQLWGSTDFTYFSLCCLLKLETGSWIELMVWYQSILELNSRLVLICDGVTLLWSCDSTRTTHYYFDLVINV